MLRFRQYINEAKEPVNGRGVLIHGNKIFVGVSHGQTPKLDTKTNAMIQQHMDKHGHWDEGNGGDAEATRPITGKRQSNGSYDEDLINKQLYTDENGNRFSPHHHVTNLFGNLPGGEQENNLISTMSLPDKTIHDTILHHQNHFFPGLGQKGMSDFRTASDKKTASMLDLPATEKNVRKFIQHGTKQSWSGNENPDTPLGRMARQVQTDREEHLLNKAPAGVYFIGSGHIPSMSKRLEGRKEQHQLIGGSTAHL